MRIIDHTLLEKLGSNAYRPAYLIDTTIDGTTLRYTSTTVEIGYNGHIYNPRGMNIGAIAYGSANIANGCSLTIDDIDRSFYALLGRSAANNWDFSITLAVLNETGTVISGAATVIFKGFITEWTFSNGKMALRLKSPFAKWARVTTRLFSTSCAVKVFKSAQCGYTGSQTFCDRSYRQCESYGNQVNFQGFRWLEDLSSRRIDLTGKTPPPAELPTYSSGSVVQGQR